MQLKMPRMIGGPLVWYLSIYTLSIRYTLIVHVYMLMCILNPRRSERARFSRDVRNAFRTRRSEANRNVRDYTGCGTGSALRRITPDLFDNQQRL